MKNKATRKLLISALILVAAVALAGTSTYAWFTMDDSPIVDSFDVQVTAGDGIYISLYGNEYSGTAPAAWTGFADYKQDAKFGAAGSFVSQISKAEIEKLLDAKYSYIQTPEIPEVVGSGEPGNPEFPAVPAVYARKSLTHGTTKAALASGALDFEIVERKIENKGHETTNYTFRLFVRSGQPFALYLAAEERVTGYPTTPATALSSVTSTTNAANKPIEAWKAFTATDGIKTDGDTDFTAAYGAPITAKAKDAARIGFTGGYISDASDSTVIQNATAVIWDPNPATGFTSNAAATNMAHLYYAHMTGDTDFPANLDLITGAALVNVKDDIYGLKLIDLLAAGAVAKDTAGYYNAYIDISIWLEGWDANAFNSILTDTLTTKLIFKGLFE